MLALRAPQLQSRRVEPSAESFAAAAEGADWSKSAFYEILTNEPGAKSWPITSATFILMHKTQDKPAQAAEVLKFFDWAYVNGGDMALELEYVPLPKATVELIRASWGEMKDSAGNPVFSAK